MYRAKRTYSCTSKFRKAEDDREETRDDGHFVVDWCSVYVLGTGLWNCMWMA